MRIAIALTCLCMSACISVADRDRSIAKTMPASLVYFKDARTGLCFAGRWLYSNGAVMSNVPCSDAVEKLLVTPTGP